MSRAYYDRVKAEWHAVAEAVHKAAGDTITLPVLHLTLIFHGYEQYQQERANTLAWIEEVEQAGEISVSAALHLRHKLGDLTDDQYDEQMRAATRRERS